MKDLVCVQVYYNRLEAELAKGILEANTIDSVILADDAGGMYPFLNQVGTGIKLMVNQEDATKALEALGQVKDN
jgi:hypothetical protein